MAPCNGDSDSKSLSVGGTYQGHPGDIVIGVMGSAEAGKSSFIKLLSSSIHSQNDTVPEAGEVHGVRCRDPIGGRNVLIVDTPGFDDSRVTDTEVLKGIAKFLVEVYDEKRKLDGLIYFQRISDSRFCGPSNHTLEMIRNLCSTDAYQKVVVLTTFWDQLISQQEGLKHETQLRTVFFQDLAKGGARFMRHNRTIESARRVLRHILVFTSVWQIQVEIQVVGKSPDDTVPSSMHREEMERINAKHKEEVADLKAELDEVRENNEAVRRELEEERAQSGRGSAQWEAERVELMMALYEAREDRRRLEAVAEEERKNHEKWRQACQELIQVDAQGKHIDLVTAQENPQTEKWWSEKNLKAAVATELGRDKPFRSFQSFLSNIR